MIFRLHTRETGEVNIVSNSKYPYIEQTKQIIKNSTEFKTWKDYVNGHIVGDIRTDDEFILQHFANELGIEINILHR